MKRTRTLVRFHKSVGISSVDNIMLSIYCVYTYMHTTTSSMHKMNAFILTDMSAVRRKRTWQFAKSKQIWYVVQIIVQSILLSRVQFWSCYSTIHLVDTDAHRLRLACESCLYDTVARCAKYTVEKTFGHWQFDRLRSAEYIFSPNKPSESIRLCEKPYRQAAKESRSKTNRCCRAKSFFVVSEDDTHHRVF